ncbi:S9 family peptidase [Perlabentimonas gracilis]|uniref:S9 family peptidase n=1 Tax=Perlabentimonas gracilis TaxID=2715279 RepID=UPI00140CA730|nr:S9 family peptidase [Perlabentimonas gracilis]NHB67831.1 S9 family peptidase [Perlabentimonas gracilis]
MISKVNTLILTVMIGTQLLVGCKSQQTPPVATKVPHELVMHNDTRIDPYYWMNQRDSEEVIEYLNQENAYTEAVMKGTEKLQEALFQEIKGRIKEQDESVPYFENGYYYYSRYDEGKEYPIYCRKKESQDAPEEVMLDVNQMAEGYAYYSVVGVNVSPNNKIVAFGVDTVSRRQYTIYFKDLETGELLNSKIPNTTGGIAWANDNTTVFYTIIDEALRPHQIYRHSVSDEGSENDALVYEENDETFRAFVYKSKSKEYIMFGSGSTLSTEFSYLSANNPLGKPKVIQPREKGLEYSVTHYGNKFYVITNLDAKNFRLMETPVTRTEKKNWKEVIPHRTDVLLSGIEVFKNFLVIDERKDGLKQLRIIDQQTRKEHYLNFGEEVYSAWISINPEYDTPLLRYAYTSMTTPFSTYDYNMATGEKILLKQTEVVGDFSPENYETKRHWVEARDGKKIPISVVYRKGVQQDGQNPALIYGYGSYGASMDPYFSSARLSLLDRGFVYVIAHIRGGEELGREWYEDGKLLKKMNTFTDFIDCSQFLVDSKYTNPDKLFAMGGSAGGLLMGAVANLRPDLYKGMIAQVPFVDVVTTMLDTSIPLTTGEYDEWGNPNDEEYYHYMKSYSPYDQVTAQDYPNMLVTTGYHDSQVQYFEPAKWVAKLRDTKTDDNILLFKTDMDAGHGGASGRFKSLRDVAFEYAFMLYLLGINS